MKRFFQDIRLSTFKMKGYKKYRNKKWVHVQAQLSSLNNIDTENFLFLLSNPPDNKTKSILSAFAVHVKQALSHIDVPNIVNSKKNAFTIDVRSPSEFTNGHIPGAYNIPLFTNEERARVGLTFRKQGRESAMCEGMEIVRPKLSKLADEVKAIVGDGANSCEVVVYCSRGGMRSHSFAYLLQQSLSTAKTFVLTDGYKGFRKWTREIYCYVPTNAGYSWAREIHQSDDEEQDFDVEILNERTLLQFVKGKNRKRLMKLHDALNNPTNIKTISEEGLARRTADLTKRLKELEVKLIAEVRRDFQKRKAQQEEEKKIKTQWFSTYSSKQPKIIIIGGRTGSGKTRILHALRDKFGKQILDLEGLACHNGSAYGAIGHGMQPTRQQFMNNVAMEWSRLDKDRLVFIEDEGPHIGSCHLPVGLYSLMRRAPVILKLDVAHQVRLSVLLQDYVGASNINRDEIGSFQYERHNINQPILSQPSAQWFENMTNATRSLERRIGRERCEEMICLLKERKFKTFAERALDYYDVLYDKHREQCDDCVTVDVIIEEMDIEKAAKLVLEKIETLHE
eukprot:g368.t1